jgi:hypothetical protein
MLRSLLCLAFCLITCDLISAADGPAKPQLPPPEAAAPASSYPVTPYATAPLHKAEANKKPANLPSRKKLEALLQTVADLDYGDRQTVTVKEVFDDLHRKHHLSIRFDVPTLSTMFGVEPMEAFENAADVLENATEWEATAQPAIKPSETPAEKKEDAVVPTEILEKKPEIKQDEIKQDAPVLEQAPKVSLVAILMNVEVKIHHVDTKKVTIGTILRHTLDALPVMGEMSEDFAGLPIKFTDASNLDYVVEGDGLLITTRMNAMTVKETRVYSIKHLKDVKPEELAKVIRHSIRPWSWRSQINDLGDQLKSGLPTHLPPELTSLMTSGFQLASAATGISVSSDSCTDCENQPLAVPMVPPPGAMPNAPTPPSPLPPSMTMPNAVPPTIAPGTPISFTPAPCNTASVTTSVQPDAAATMIALNTLVNGLVTFAHASLSAMEMIHFADPPTGTIQTLPGRLVVTQSQAAHREIAELLKQLEEE